MLFYIKLNVLYPAEDNVELSVIISRPSDSDNVIEILFSCHMNTSFNG